MYNIKKAAMFGLDARIALAIFGALSVISGAALYSAIQESKVTKQIVQLEEIGKALDAFYLDVGSLPGRAALDDSNAYYYRLTTSQLVQNFDNYNGWQGPYIAYSYSGNYIKDPEFGNNINILTYSTDSWSDPWGNNSVWCVTRPNCSIWVNIRGYQGTVNSLILSLDKKIDNSDGASTGRFRWDYVNSTVGNDIFYNYRAL
jgi:type II secretory pathway pseudopilin PulG